MKAWTVDELITALAQFPRTAEVYLRDADTRWVIHQFELMGGHAEKSGTISDRGVIINPSDYDDMSSGLDFLEDKK